MDTRNIFPQNQTTNGYYPYSLYPAATAAYTRPEVPTYMMPQTAASALKGRPVSSFEEARVAQIDLDGSIAIFPDLGNKKIYTKRINVDGTAAINTYALEEQTENTAIEYATKSELQEIKSILENLVANTKTATPPKAAAKPVLNF